MVPPHAIDGKVNIHVRAVARTVQRDGSLAAETGISGTSVQRCIKLFRLQPQRSASFKLSIDPSFLEKFRDVVDLYLNPPDKALVLCR